MRGGGYRLQTLGQRGDALEGGVASIAHGEGAMGERAVACLGSGARS